MALCDKVFKLYPEVLGSLANILSMKHPAQFCYLEESCSLQNVDEFETGKIESERLVKRLLE